MSLRDNDYKLNVAALTRAVEEENNHQRYKPHEQNVSEWCNEHDVEEIDRIKLPSDFYKMKREEQDAEIVKAIQTMYPDRVDERIYHFPFQRFYIVTDKGFYFTLKSKARPFTSKEERRIARLRETVKDMEDNQHFQTARSKYLTEKDLRDKGFMEGDKHLCSHQDINILISYKESKDEIADEVECLQNKCQKERFFTLAPHDLSRQVSIYINQKIAYHLEKLGYKVHESTRSEIVRNWNDKHLNWDYQTMETKHLFVKMSKTVFISACKSGKLLPAGRYLDEEGNEVEMKRGRSKGCSNGHLSKSITLFDPTTNELLPFLSIGDAAKHFGMDRSNFATKVRGLTLGDYITVKKRRYIIATSDTAGKE